MKKYILLGFSLLIVLFSLTACKDKGTKINGHTVYKTEITSIKTDSDQDWKITGTTDAPDGTKILAFSNDKSDYYNWTLSYTDSDWVKVKDGKFKLAVDPTEVTNDDAWDEANKDIKVTIVAVSEYDKDADDEAPKALVKGIRKNFTPEKLTTTKKQVKYKEKLEEEDSDEEDSDSDSSSSESRDNEDEDTDSEDTDSSVNTSDKSQYQSVTYDQLARTPDDFKKKLITISGTVLQSIVGEDGTTELIVDTTGNGDVIEVLEMNKSSVRHLEGDSVTIYGVSGGLTSYESSGSGTVTAPLIGAYIIE
ncbi:hypothetical protein FC14_GL000483 [Ligilactobacillus agilis DSM 20509]|uniref:Lipoprotein n=1 Tax=Ligilactobacillus agilis DSM 20509 TaxID=1423718 RepID=A0A0R2A7X8_9LACO|nr:hypothetical protein [Ligilactobacillus agilis]KRM63448.1 hypothetical protein FC14_GL000483 [Ligilactobacillus agilis DSM 20509]